MALLSGIIEWTKDTFAAFGPSGIFFLAFIESIFFPVPPDILLIVFTLASPDLGIFYALICTAGSVTGAMLGYWIGFKGGRPILEKLVKHKTITKIHKLFEKYEAWAIGIAGFTPIPYKVFTIAGGVFYVNFSRFIIASILSRSARFIMVALVVMEFGKNLINILDKYILLLTLLGILSAAGYVWWRKKSK